MDHNWEKTILRPKLIKTPKGSIEKPEVVWWPHCSTCGAQVCKVGNNLYYRSSAWKEWSLNEPACQ